MKKLLKSFLIATASIGAIAGSTAAVVSCGSSGDSKSENQTKYDNAIEVLKGKLGSGDSTILDKFHVTAATTDFTTVQNEIQARVDKIVNDDASLKDVLGASTVKAPASAFDVTTAGAAVKVANNITLSVASDLSDVTLPNPLNISIKYTVVSTAQSAFDDAVKAIMATITANAIETRNTFQAGTSATTEIEVQKHLFQLINNAIPEGGNALVKRFAQATEITGLVEAAKAIHNQIGNGAATGQTIIMDKIVFASITGGLVTDPQQFTFHYSIAASLQAQYDAQKNALISKFTTTGAGSFVADIVNNTSNGDVISMMQTAVTTEITNNASIYSLINSSGIMLSGLKPNAFAHVPAAGSDIPSNTLTAGAMLVVPSKDTTNIHPTPAGYAFQFYYSIDPSQDDKTAYTTAIGKVVSHFNEQANAITFAQNADTTDGWQTAVKAAITTAINTYVKSDATIAAVLDVSKIAITITGNSFVTNTTVGSVHNTTQVSFAIPSVWSDIVPSSQNLPLWVKVPGTPEQEKYIAEAQAVLSLLSIYTKDNHPILVHVGDTPLKVKTAIATSLNSAIASLSPAEKTKIGVIPLNAIDASITGTFPDTTGVSPAAIKELQIKIPTIATSGVIAESLSEDFSIQVVAASEPDQAAYDSAFQNVLAAVPASTNSLFNWSATLPAGATPPAPPASAHWLGGLGFVNYDGEELDKVFNANSGVAFQNLIKAAAPEFGVVLQANGTVLGVPTATTHILPVTTPPAPEAHMDLTRAGTYNFQLEIQFAGGANVTVHHTIILGFTITITAA